MSLSKHRICCRLHLTGHARLVPKERSVNLALIKVRQLKVKSSTFHVLVAMHPTPAMRPSGAMTPPSRQRARGMRVVNLFGVHLMSEYAIKWVFG